MTSKFQSVVLGGDSSILSRGFIWGILSCFAEKQMTIEPILDSDIVAWGRLRDACKKLRTEMRVCNDDPIRAENCGIPCLDDVIDLYRMTYHESLSYNEESIIGKLLTEASNAFFECSRIIERNQIVKEHF